MNVDEDVSKDSGDLDNGYEYLLCMKIWSLTREKVSGITMTTMRDQTSYFR